MELDTSKGSVGRNASYHFKASTQVWSRTMQRGPRVHMLWLPTGGGPQLLLQGLDLGVEQDNDNGDPGFTCCGCPREGAPSFSLEWLGLSLLFTG